MESAGKVMSAFNLSALKEPRGFIKIIQWILSIFAFATTTSVSSIVSFHFFCPKDQNATEVKLFQSGTVSYPFKLEDVKFFLPFCKGDNITGYVHLLQGAKPAAEFYVFVGVIVFLYCLAALVLYLFFDSFYREHNFCTVGDFVASCVIVLLWLISSSAWAQGVTDVKYYSDLSESGFFDKIPECSLHRCAQDSMGNYASLNVSIIFGFLNMLVWAGNLWFLYKETPWHKVQANQPAMPSQPTGQGSMPADMGRI